MSSERRWLLIVLTAAFISIVSTTGIHDVIPLFSGLIDQERSAMQEPDDDKRQLDEYDFIIVGAGAAGCVLANRLTEITDWNILLLEAGGQETSFMDIPNLGAVVVNEHNSWQYETVPSETKYKSFKNQQLRYEVGKVMGGSTTINYMINVRGNKFDYDNWESVGNPGWSYENVLPYFKKIEDIQIPELRNSTYHSTTGNVKVSYSPHLTDLSSIIIKSLKEMDYPEVDYNGENQYGCSRCQTTTVKGTRWSGSRGYLHPIRSRPNLHVKKNALVTKLLIDEDTKTAYGVTYMKGDETYTVRAKMEVILSAGALGSPQLLMLAGIGPKEHLEELGIKVIQNLQVGYNAMDHPAFLGLLFTTNSSITPSKIDNALDDSNYYLFGALNNGPLTSNFGVQAVSFLKVKNSLENIPDVECVYYDPPFIDDAYIAERINANEEFLNVYITPLLEQPYYQILCTPLRPKSRGKVTLKDNNILTLPLYDPNFYDTEEDIEIGVAAIRKIIELNKAPTLQNIKSTLYDTPLPACTNFTFGTDEYWRCGLLQASHHSWNICGTCKMGPSTDSTAVVDPELKVHGINNLRVIDASIIPQIPSGHLSIPTYMIAEKGADMIKMKYVTADKDGDQPKEKNTPEKDDDMTKEKNIPEKGGDMAKEKGIPEKGDDMDKEKGIPEKGSDMTKDKNIPGKGSDSAMS